MIQFYTPAAHQYAKYLARKYHFYEQSDFDDLKAEAVIGLIRALDKYDPNHISGAQFWTYAIAWVKQQVQRFIWWRQAGPATISSHLLSNSQNKPKTYAVPIFSPIDNDNQESETADQVAFKALRYTESNETKSNESNQIDVVWATAQKTLTEKQVFVLRARYIHGRKLLDIGTEMGVSRERIRQIEKDAIERLQLALV